jgi:hypothetical protein
LKRFYEKPNVTFEVPTYNPNQCAGRSVRIFIDALEFAHFLPFLSAFFAFLDALSTAELEFVGSFVFSAPGT